MAKKRLKKKRERERQIALYQRATGETSQKKIKNVSRETFNSIVSKQEKKEKKIRQTEKRENANKNKALSQGIRREDAAHFKRVSQANWDKEIRKYKDKYRTERKVKMLREKGVREDLIPELSKQTFKRIEGINKQDLPQFYDIPKPPEKDNQVYVLPENFLVLYYDVTGERYDIKGALKDYMKMSDKQLRGMIQEVNYNLRGWKNAGGSSGAPGTAIIDHGSSAYTDKLSYRAKHVKMPMQKVYPGNSKAERRKAKRQGMAYKRRSHSYTEVANKNEWTTHELLAITACMMANLNEQESPQFYEQITKYISQNKELYDKFMG